MIAALLLAGAAPAEAATTRYAAPDGSGTLCTQAAPCSIETAFSAPSDAVELASGDYATASTLDAGSRDVHGESGKPRPDITYSGGGAAIEGDLITRLTHIRIDAPSGRGVDTASCDGTVFQDLVVDSAGDGLACATGIGFLVRNAVVHSGAGGPALRFAAGLGGDVTGSLRNVTATSSGSYALELVGSNIDPPCTTASSGSDVHATVNARNTILRATGTDIRLRGGCFAGATSLDIDYSNFGSGSTEVDNTGTTAEPSVGSVTDGGHNQHTAPLFTADGFHEQPTSPTVDAGTEDAQTGTADIDGGARELGLAPDMGADELAPSPTAMATPHSNAQALLLHDGRVLVAGGFGSGTYPRNAELFDPATGHWSNGGYLSTGRSQAAASVLESGKVILSGGTTLTVQPNAELYDPATNAWSPGGTLTGRRLHTSTLLGTGKVLVAGGLDSTSTALKSTSLYNPVTNAWGTGGLLGTARYFHTATLLEDGSVLVVGGLSGLANSDTLASAERSSNGVSGWTATGSMATPRSAHTATLLQDGRVLVVGGDDASGEEVASAELYDPASGAWTPAASMAKRRAFHTATLLRDGRVLVRGGFSPGEGDLASSEIYNPATDRWSAGPALATPRATHTSTALRDGRVLTAGGEALASSELTGVFAPNAVARRPVVAYVDPQGHFGLYDSETSTDVAPPPVPDGVQRFATSLDGRYVLYADGAPPHHLHMYDRRARAAVALPGVDVFANPDGLTVSDGGLIAFDDNSNGPMRAYDTKTKAFVSTGLVNPDSMSESDNFHRQPRLSGDGRWLATTCQAHCVSGAPVSGSDLFVQNLVTKTDFPMPNFVNHDNEHPCIDGDGSRVGADITSGGKTDVSLYARVTGGLLPVPNDPVLKDLRCQLDASGRHVSLQDDNDNERLYDRLTGALVPLPSKVHGRVSLSDPLDLTPPETTLVGGPSGLTGRRTARFAFVSSEAGGSFQCRLDGGAFKPCSSPRLYAGLKDGKHTFRVRAVDAAGNVDPSPAIRSWTIGAFVTRVAISPHGFKAAHGARVSFGATRALNATFTVCRKTKHGCARVKGSLRRSAKLGGNQFEFHGRVGGQTLKPGRYTLIARPGGKRAGFRIKHA
ncbi:MAG: kelch repeat-containing protein [Thermoleophilaceae bacterium]